MGPNRCHHSDECAGDRYCSLWNWCAGESNCDVTAPVPVPDPVEGLQTEVDALELRVDTLETDVTEIKAYIGEGFEESSLGDDIESQVNDSLEASQADFTDDALKQMTRGMFE